MTNDVFTNRHSVTWDNTYLGQRSHCNTILDANPTVFVTISDIKYIQAYETKLTHVNITHVNYKLTCIFIERLDFSKPVQLTLILDSWLSSHQDSRHCSFINKFSEVIIVIRIWLNTMILPYYQYQMYITEDDPFLPKILGIQDNA